jgi:hypothetical protein
MSDLVSNVEFPTDGSPSSFEALHLVLRHALDQVAVPREVPENGIDWKGPTSIVSDQHVTFPPPDVVTPEGLRREQSRGRDALDVVLLLALRIGIEQGRRITEGGDEIRIMRKVSQAFSARPSPENMREIIQSLLDRPYPTDEEQQGQSTPSTASGN